MYLNMCSCEICDHSWPIYKRWMDGFRLSDKVLLKLEERKGKELIITMAESMSRGAALTFSSLCIATIKKRVCVCAPVFKCRCVCVHMAVCTFVCVRKTQR